MTTYITSQNTKNEYTAGLKLIAETEVINLIETLPEILKGVGIELTPDKVLPQVLRSLEQDYKHLRIKNNAFSTFDSSDEHSESSKRTLIAFYALEFAKTL